VELWRQPVRSTERERAAEGRPGNECGAFIDVSLRQVLFYFDLEMQTVNKRKPSKTGEILAEHNRKKRAAVGVTTALRVK